MYVLSFFVFNENVKIISLEKLSMFQTSIHINNPVKRRVVLGFEALVMKEAASHFSGIANPKRFSTAM
ncbi:hypothetical protein E2320_009643 [Naja naja]|nr:hypothetical protein E2320_009643 [Naja naja]